MIKICHVDKNYGNSCVLHDVNGSFENGEIHGLLGVNGAGKSTLLRILSGVYAPDKGEVRLDEEIITENAKAKAKIFFLSDDPYYGGSATIESLAKLYRSFYPHFSEEELFKNLDLLSLHNAKPLSTFSKGMRRKAYIALALASGCEVLLFDEVFDGLDPTSRQLFKRMLSGFIALSSNHLVLIASHSLREMEDIADSFSLLKDGSLQSLMFTSATTNPLKKIQLAFAEAVDPRAFSGIKVLRASGDGRFVQLLAEGEEKDLRAYLMGFHPLLLEIAPASLEETFIEETEEKE
jgi:ABC-2 type transport system ATP-binding protein